MLKSKQVLEEYLLKQCDLIVLDNDICKEIYTYANQTYDMPKGIILDLISKRMDMAEVSEFVLFVLLDAMCKILPDDKMKFKTDYFYTPEKIKFYGKSKYKMEKITFPLKFKMVEIVEKQHWIGKITVEELMKMRRAQLINYNMDTQRTMQKIVNGEKEIWKSTLYPKTVKEIQSSLENGTFISNAITLNIPTDTNYDFNYDENTNTLTINSLEHFDITDGFHRYVAACRAKDKNAKFDYPFELRIFNFIEEDAKHFIFQEDQKTKMRKIDSDSLNMHKAANIVVERVNKDINCEFKGLISRNNGIIPFAELAELVNYFYFKKTKKTEENLLIRQTVIELIENFNSLVQYDETYLERRMSYRTLTTIMFCFNYFKGNKDKKYVCKIIEEAVKKVEENKSDKFRNHIPRKNQMTEIENIVKEVEMWQAN